jgi:peptidoglycan-associated lipoprotein
MSIPHRTISALAHAGTAAALALAAVACGGAEKQTPVATAPPPAPVPVPPPPAPPSPPPETHVAISPDILRACGISEADAFFPFDSAKIMGKPASPLDRIAVCFTSGPLAGRAMKLVGRTDPRGESEYNMTLGQSRADAVASYLEVHGLSPAKASSSSRGAMDAKGTDEKTWANDRRVDILLAE